MLRHDDGTANIGIGWVRERVQDRPSQSSAGRQKKFILWAFHAPCVEVQPARGHEGRGCLEEGRGESLGAVSPAFFAA